MTGKMSKDSQAVIILEARLLVRDFAQVLEAVGGRVPEARAARCHQIAAGLQKIARELTA